MDRQFEERLRQSLQARATDVRPDPRTWEKVQRRIDRQRTFRFASGAALAAAAVVGVIVVGPSLLNGPFEVDLERGAPADQTVEPAPSDPVGPQTDDPSPGATPQTGTEPSRALEPGQLGFVTTDGNSLSITDASGRVLATLFQYGEPDEMCGGEECGYPIQDFTVRPNDEDGQVTVVWRAGIGCGAHLNWLVYDGAGTMHGSLAVDSCPGAAAFSPDGTHLAWTEGDPSDPAAFTITIVEWVGDLRSELPTVVGSPWGFLVDADDLFRLDIQDWVWVEDTGGYAAGYLALRAHDADERPLGFTYEIERQGDGQLAVPATALRRAEWVAFAFGDVGSDGVGPEFTVTLEDDAPHFAHGADDGLAPIHVDDHRQPVDGAPQWWVSALGQELLVGDGRGRAWRAVWVGGPAQGEESYRVSAWDEVPGRVVHAEVVVLQRESGQSADPAVEPLPAQEGLPHEVEEIRQAIAAAARTGNIDQLVMLTQITDQFITGADGSPEDDPRAFFTELAERGELEQLAIILEFAHGTQEPEGGPVYYVWPYALAVDDFNSLSSAQLQQLEALAGPGELAQWEEFGAYIGPRIGIEERGAWRFYILGGD